MCTELDDAFEALSSPIRRVILLALYEENTVPEEDVLPQNGVPPASDELESARVMVHHCHLPKLERLGFIDRNTGGGTLTKGARWEEIAPLVELLEEHREELPDGWPGSESLRGMTSDI